MAVTTEEEDAKSSWQAVAAWKLDKMMVNFVICPDLTKTFEGLEDARRYRDELRLDKTLDRVRIIEVPCVSGEPMGLAFCMSAPRKTGVSTHFWKDFARTFDSDAEFQAFSRQVFERTVPVPTRAVVGQDLDCPLYEMTPTTFVPCNRNAKAARCTNNE